MSHITPFKERLENITSVSRFVRGYAGKPTEVVAEGDMIFTIPSQYGGKTIRIKNVLWAPQANSTLISLGRLDDAGWKYIGGSGKLTLFNRTNDIITRIPKKDGLYKITHDFAGTIDANSMSLSLYEIHVLLGHVS